MLADAPLGVVFSMVLAALDSVGSVTEDEGRFAAGATVGALFLVRGAEELFFATLTTLFFEFVFFFDSSSSDVHIIELPSEL